MDIKRFLPFVAIGVVLLLAVFMNSVEPDEPRPVPHPTLAELYEYTAPFVAGDQSTDDIEGSEDLVAVVFETILQHHIDDPGERALVAAAISGIEALNPVIGEETIDRLADASIRGMMATLDPHSFFISAPDFRRQQSQRQRYFAGIGVEITKEGRFLQVIAPFDDMPAFRAGILPGDLITHIDGNDAEGFDIHDAVERIRGNEGSSVVLTIRRIGTPPFDVTLTREIIATQPVRHRLLDGVGYVRIVFFSEGAARGVEQAIETLREESGNSLAGIVLDLRRNPSGLVDSGVSISDLFLEEGVVGHLRTRRPENDLEFRAIRGGQIGGATLAVLIDGGTAGVAELVAGALQENRRAVLIGTASAGRGSTAQIFELRRGSAIWLTFARYETPSGRSFDGIGIAPDIGVGGDLDASIAGYGHFQKDRCLSVGYGGGDDDVLSCALAFIRSGSLGNFYSRMSR